VKNNQKNTLDSFKIDIEDPDYYQNQVVKNSINEIAEDYTYMEKDQKERLIKKQVQ
jgi:hypothetical protein